MSARVERANTQALLPTMNMARQLSEAGAYELFSAQNLGNADSESEWLAQGRMLTAQSLKISGLLDQLRAQGFDTSAIAQQEMAITQSLGEQGELVGQRLQLRARQRQLSAQIAAAAGQIADLAKGQASNAATAAGSDPGRYLRLDRAASPSGGGASTGPVDRHRSGIS
ncbi:Sensor protein torS [Edwardsiella tarda]|nr:Sensor protein torS [Edwardsiella tarda]